jgi:hypothetical protein
MSRILTPPQTKAPPAPQRMAPPPPAAPTATAAPKMVMPVMGAAIGTRSVLVATEGYGKTSCGAMADSPVFICTPDELGYDTLFQRGLVPACPVMKPRSWSEMLAAIEFIAREPGQCKTLVIDAMAGIEALCAAHVCAVNFEGDWGERGFQAWGRGKSIVAREFPAIFPRLTACSRKGVDVLLLGHAKVETFKNPEGADYDRFVCNIAVEPWQKTKAWAEAVLFGNFRAIVDEAKTEKNIAKAKGKAIGQQRIMRCQYSASADAKNQYGLAPEYTMPDNPAQFAVAFWGLIKPSASPAPQAQESQS